eukprot:1395122-Amorphochlora_amoeboformis.AAC.1
MDARVRDRWPSSWKITLWCACRFLTFCFIISAMMARGIRDLWKLMKANMMEYPGYNPGVVLLSLSCPYFWYKSLSPETTRCPDVQVGERHRIGCALRYLPAGRVETVDLYKKEQNSSDSLQQQGIKILSLSKLQALVDEKPRYVRCTVCRKAQRGHCGVPEDDLPVNVKIAYGCLRRTRGKYHPLCITYPISLPSFAVYEQASDTVPMLIVRRKVRIWGIELMWDLEVDRMPDVRKEVRVTFLRRTLCIEEL